MVNQTKQAETNTKEDSYAKRYGRNRPHKEVMLDAQTLADLEYLRVALSPMGEREPLEYSTAARVFLTLAPLPSADSSFEFVKLERNSPTNKEIHFWLDEFSYNRWMELVRVYQAMLDQQVAAGKRKKSSRRVKAADVMRLVIRQAAGQRRSLLLMPILFAGLPI